MNSVLGESLPNNDSKDPQQSLAWLDFQWRLAVGKDLASVTQVKKISTKSLFVTVSDVAWLSPLGFLREQIINTINQRAGLILLNRIVFQESSLAGPTLKNFSKDKKHYSLEQNTMQLLEPNESETKEESMGNILDRISRKLGVVLSVVLLASTSNCTTISKDQVSQNMDLSHSYAVKAVEKISEERSSENVRDPRAYYHYLMALRAVEGHQFEQASENFRKVVEFDSSNFKFSHQLAINLIRSGKIDDAYKALNESLVHFPNNPELNMMIGDILAGRGENERALSHYQTVIETKSGLARAYLLSGSIFESQKQYDDAENMYRNVLQVEPMNPLGHHYLARMHILKGKLEDAQKSINTALELRPNLLQAREWLAWTLEAQGKPDDAKKQYKILLQLNPLSERSHQRMTSMKDFILPMDIGSGKYRVAAEEILGAPDVHSKIGAVYYEQGIYLKALDEFQLLRGKGQEKEILMVLGRIYEILGRLDKAIQEIKNLLKIEPQSAHLKIYLARLYSMNQRPEKTVQLIEEVIKIDQKNDSLYHSLAIAYISIDQLDSAINAMEKAITIDPKKDSYYFELGALLERTGKFELAIKNIKRSIELNPMHSNAHNFLGYIYAIQGKSLDLALGHLNKALSIQPKNGYFLDSLSWIYFKKGESEKALKELKKAMVYTSPDPVLYSHLGDIHFSLTNFAEAGKAWKTSLFLTLEKKDDIDSELPDPKELEKKIKKARRFLSNN
jgi:tetratricopeptide (TPR) repeat protein